MEYSILYKNMNIQMKRGVLFEYIKLQRTMCFGTYPVYSVMVDNEGNVKLLEKCLYIRVRSIIGRYQGKSKSVK